MEDQNVVLIYNNYEECVIKAVSKKAMSHKGPFETQPFYVPKPILVRDRLTDCLLLYLMMMVMMNRIDSNSQARCLYNVQHESWLPQHVPIKALEMIDCIMAAT